MTFLIKESGKEEIFFTLLKEINWILLFPIHNILKGIGLGMSCLKLKFGMTENLLGMTTQCEILGFCRLG